MSRAQDIAIRASGGTALSRPRIGFVGLGWIGSHRMKSLLDHHACDAVAIVEPQRELAEAARNLAPDSATICSFEELLDQDVDGIVIATPSAMHAEQAVAALQRGVSVFCQKPLGRNREETQRVIDAARAADRLLCVDFSYRFLRGMQQIRELVQTGELGIIYAIETEFHNAYGPDKTWFYEPQQSGGGCLIDLGIHLVDLALWIMQFPAIRRVSGNIFLGGRPFGGRERNVEDHAIATLGLENNTVVRLACSWRAHAGCDASVQFRLFGTEGGARLQNVNGSFFDFVTERFRGTNCELLSGPPENWGGRAIVDWLKQLCRSQRFNPEAEQYAHAAAALDRIYESCEF
jgi:predicted dehydrogenase